MDLCRTVGIAFGVVIGGWLLLDWIIAKADRKWRDKHYRRINEARQKGVRL